jgi:hypothetical protein
MSRVSDDAGGLAAAAELEGCARQAAACPALASGAARAQAERVAERLRDKKMRMELSDAAVDYLAVRRCCPPPPLEPPPHTPARPSFVTRVYDRMRGWARGQAVPPQPLPGKTSCALVYLASWPMK